MRLGHHPYATKAIADKKVHREFLDTLARIRPEMIRALAADVLPVYAEAAEWARSCADPRAAAHLMKWHTVGAARPDSWPDLLPLAKPLNGRWPTVGAPIKLGLWPELVPVADALRAWAAKWLPKLCHGPESAWFFDAALFLLRLWHRHPSLVGHHKWLGHTDSWAWPLTPEEETPPSVRKDPQEKWEEYHERRRSGEAAWKQQYEERLKQYGWHPAKVLRVKDGISPELRFEWLVRYMMGESCSAIAHRHDKFVDSKSVRKAIVRASELVGLSLKT